MMREEEIAEQQKKRASERAISGGRMAADGVVSYSIEQRSFQDGSGRARQTSQYVHRKLAKPPNEDYQDVQRGGVSPVDRSEPVW